MLFAKLLGDILRGSPWVRGQAGDSGTLEREKQGNQRRKG